MDEVEATRSERKGSCVRDERVQACARGGEHLPIAIDAHDPEAWSPAAEAVRDESWATTDVQHQPRIREPEAGQGGLLRGNNPRLGLEPPGLCVRIAELPDSVGRLQDAYDPSPRALTSSRRAVLTPTSP